MNGRIVTELATQIEPGDIVQVDGTTVALPSSFTYVLLNKPAGHVVTLSDPHGRPIVTDLLDGLEARVVPVGRLDAPTEGLIILTDDGDLAHRVAHPSFELDKVYEVEAEGVLESEELRLLESGIELDGRMTAPARVTVLSAGADSTRAEITIHEGRKRQVRRMFELIGHPVTRLTRTRVGPLELGDLRPGKWRRMSDSELSSLREAIGLAED